MATDTPMQLGMVGLGRMGAGIVRRLMRDGHRCVGYDVHPDAVKALEADGADRLVVARGVRGEAREAARRLGDGARGRHHRRRRSPRSRRCSSPATRSSTAATRTTSRTSATPHDARARRASTTSTSGRAAASGASSAGFCLMIGGEDGGRRPPLPHLRVGRARRRGRDAHARPHRRSEPGRARLLPLRRRTAPATS